MMTQKEGKMVDNNGNEVNYTHCPRCGTVNQLVNPKRPDVRSVNGVVYDLYRTVCIQCSLFFKDALIHVGVEE